MTIKTKTTKSLTLKTLIPDIERAFTSDILTREVRLEVIRTIQSGKSPVEGARKFKDYSELYSKRKKGGRLSPVDMTDTGKMMRSLLVEKTSKSYRLVFDSDVADYHNRLGAGRGRDIRRLLPTKRGERFINQITKRILKNANKAANIATKKQNR